MELLLLPPLILILSGFGTIFYLWAYYHAKRNDETDIKVFMFISSFIVSFAVLDSLLYISTQGTINILNSGGRLVILLFISPAIYSLYGTKSWGLGGYISACAVNLIAVILLFFLILISRQSH